jgi:simple sugar transport system permease protein
MSASWGLRWLKREEAGVSFALLLLIAFFGLSTDDFLSLRTFGSIATFASVLGVIALGSTLLMIAGEYDLSVGSTAALSGMIFSMGLVQWKMNSFLLLALVLVLGAGIGLLNGFITLSTRIPSFITTLGTMLIWRGAVLSITGGVPISLMEEPHGVLLLFGGRLGNGFQTAVIAWVFLAAFFSWLLKCTPFGNHILATGGNSAVTRAMGVNTDRIKLSCFALCGTLSALAGVILFSEMKDLSPTAGESYELYAIACAVIGGTALTGGRGTVMGTALGTVLIGVIQAGLVHLGADSFWFRTFVGLLLILAVILNLRLRHFAEEGTA